MGSTIGSTCIYISSSKHNKEVAVVVMIFKLLLAVALVGTASTYEPDAPPVKVEMFCNIDSNSCRWDFTIEVPDVYYELKDTGIMDLSFNLYGNTEEPFGPDEFYESKLCECVIHYNTNNDTLVDWFKCFFDRDHFSYADVDGKRCSEELGLEWDVLEGCYLSDEGKELLIDAGRKFHTMKPPVSVFPEYYMDGHPKMQAYGDLKEWICNAYTGTPPPECSES